MTTATPPITVRQDGDIALVTIDRQEVLNALTPEMIEELIGTLRRLGSDRNVGAIVLTGAGRAFTGGADVRIMAAASPPDFRSFIANIQELTRVLRSSRAPTIAAVNGLTVGAGCEIVCACDLRIASTNATFMFPEVRIGLTVTSGASYLLPRLVGRGWARRLLLTGEAIPAKLACEIGLVDTVVEPGEVVGTAIARGMQICENDPLAIALTRRMLDDADEISLNATLHQEEEAILSCLMEGTAKERMGRFVSRRKPESVT